MLEASLGNGWDSRLRLGWRTAAVYREVVVGSARRVKDLNRAVMVRTEYAGLIYIPSQVPCIYHHQLPWRYTPRTICIAAIFRMEGCMSARPASTMFIVIADMEAQRNHHDPSLDLWRRYLA